LTNLKTRLEKWQELAMSIKICHSTQCFSVKATYLDFPTALSPSRTSFFEAGCMVYGYLSVATAKERCVARGWGEGAGDGIGVVVFRSLILGDIEINQVEL
jgi:hypothetical protein